MLVLAYFLLTFLDHNILLEELRGLEVSPSITSWIAGFLAGCNQAVTIEETLSDWKTLNRGTLQGTKLGQSHLIRREDESPTMSLAPAKKICRRYNRRRDSTKKFHQFYKYGSR